ncbi:MAG: DUF4345 domain-containing protein [Nakamurella sp.]
MSWKTRFADNRQVLIGLLAALGAVPVATGTAGVLLGPAGAPGGGPTTASVDSEYRFVNVFWAAAGGVLWWTLRDAEKRARVTQLVLGLAAAGGVPRLLSWRRSGAPHPVFRGALVLELLIVPLVLVWHRRTFIKPSR